MLLRYAKKLNRQNLEFDKNFLSLLVYFENLDKYRIKKKWNS